MELHLVREESKNGAGRGRRGRPGGSFRDPDSGDDVQQNRNPGMGAESAYSFGVGLGT